MEVNFLQISRWIKTADVAKLEHAVYMGKGAHMRGRTAWNEDTRRFLQTVPKTMSTIDSFHAAAETGVMADFERLLLSDRRLIGSRLENLG